MKFNPKWTKNSLYIFAKYLILVLPATTHIQPKHVLHALMNDREELNPSHDWYQTEKHIVITIYTKRKGIGV